MPATVFLGSTRDRTTSDKRVLPQLEQTRDTATGSPQRECWIGVDQRIETNLAIRKATAGNVVRTPH